MKGEEMAVRHRLVGMLLGATLSVGLLTACSTEVADTPGGGAVSNAAFPLTVEHIFGNTTVPEQPERIVTLGVTDADVVLALGSVPVGNTGMVIYKSGLGPWAESLVGDAELTRIESDSKPNLEQVAGLEPDLIIGVSAGFDEETYALLSKIAPTVARPTGTAAYAVPRDQATESIATAMGLAAKGTELNHRTDNLIAETVATNPKFAGKTGLAVMPYDGTYGACLPGDGRGQFLTSLGFRIPESIASKDTGESFYVEVSAENIDLLDSDVMLVLGPDENFDIVAENPAFRTLRSARNNAIIAATLDQRGAMTYNSVLSIPYAIDSFVPRLADIVR